VPAHLCRQRPLTAETPSAPLTWAARAKSGPSPIFNPRNCTWPGLNVLSRRREPDDPGSRQVARYEQARILGGGSSINGLIWSGARAPDETYDCLEDLAATAGTYRFRAALISARLERDSVRFRRGPIFCNDGSITIRPIRRAVERLVAGVASGWKPPRRAGAAALPQVGDQTAAWVRTAMMPCLGPRATANYRGAGLPRWRIIRAGRAAVRRTPHTIPPRPTLRKLILFRR